MKKILLLLVVIATTSIAFSQAPPMYITSPYADSLWTVSDTSTMAVTDSVQMTLPGYTITGSNGLTINQCSGAAYVSIKISGITGRMIASIDLTTGVTDTIVLVPDNIANIDLINDSIIAIVFGDGAVASEALGFVNVNDSTYTALGPSSGSGSDGESMAYCPDNNRLYRWSGRDTDNTMDYYDVALPVGVDVPITGYDFDEIFGSTYIGGGKFLLTNLDQEFLLADTSGLITLLPQTTNAIGYAKGLAFGGPSISFVAAGTDTICPFGDSTLITSSGALGYQWYMDGSLIAGATSQTYAAMTPGTFTCEITSGPCVAFASESLVVSTFAVDPAGSTPPSPSFCAGDSVLLTGNTGTGFSEWWFGGAPVSATNTVNATIGGDYAYHLQTGACYNEIVVTVIENALPTVGANADQPLYCDGDQVTLTGSGADTYAWDNSVIDGTPFSQAVGPPVMYHVTGTSTAGCMNVDSILVKVFANPTASGTSTDEILGSDGAIDGTFTGAPTLTFDWDNDGTGDFDDTEDLAGLTAGDYTVVVRDGNGCTSTTTVTVNSQVGLNEFGLNASMTIYPNPNNGVFAVEFENMATENLSVEIINTAGQIVFVSNVTGDSVHVDVQEFGAGVYTLRITDGTHNATEQIIVGK